MKMQFHSLTDGAYILKKNTLVTQGLSALCNFTFLTLACHFFQLESNLL